MPHSSEYHIVQNRFHKKTDKLGKAFFKYQQDKGIARGSETNRRLIEIALKSEGYLS